MKKLASRPQIKTGPRTAKPTGNLQKESKTPGACGAHSWEADTNWRLASLRAVTCWTSQPSASEERRNSEELISKVISRKFNSMLWNLERRLCTPSGQVHVTHPSALSTGMHQLSTCSKTSWTLGILLVSLASSKGVLDRKPGNGVGYKLHGSLPLLCIPLIRKLYLSEVSVS